MAINNVKYHLPDQFFEDSNSLVDVLNSTFPKSVLICGGTSRTWDVQDTVFDIHSARVRERLRQSGILVVNPTGLFDSLPKRADDSWHFKCLRKYARSHNVVDTTLLSLESLISHVVLITHHLIESNEAINARGDTSWISSMEAKAARAHLTLAIQYDPREDVLPLSYSRRPNERGSGTMDLQSRTSFGIGLSLLRGRVLKARAQPGGHSEGPDACGWPMVRRRH